MYLIIARHRKSFNLKFTIFFTVFALILAFLLLISNKNHISAVSSHLIDTWLIQETCLNLSALIIPLVLPDVIDL